MSDDVSEKHWDHTNPDQPPRDMVESVSQLVKETQARLGKGATAAEIMADLKARDVEVDEATVQKCMT